MKDDNYYIIDTSSLIELNRHNPLDVFPSVWAKLAALIGRGVLLSHKEVYNELTRKDDQLVKWAKEQKDFFREHTEKQIQLVKKILSKYPSLVNPDRLYAADPWVIALAVELATSPQTTLSPVKRIVVTEEKERGSRVKIPLVCKEYDIECLDIIDMFREEGWKF